MKWGLFGLLREDSDILPRYPSMEKCGFKGLYNSTGIGWNLEKWKWIISYQSLIHIPSGPGRFGDNMIL